METATTRCMILRQCVAELCGTFFLVLFGTGSVACAVTTGELMGLHQVAFVWGFGVCLSIFATAAVSGAHLNPAVSFAFAIFRPKDMPLWKLLPYILAQLLGAMLASAAVLVTFHGALRRMDDELATASAFGEYFPNPGVVTNGKLVRADVSPAGAFGIEAFGTSILMFFILALTDERNAARPPPGMAPFFIGFLVCTLISVFAPLTQAGWNPARDFGPRVVAAMAGWGDIAIPGPRHGFWVYIVGPLVGAPLGAAAWDVCIRPGLPPLPPPKTSGARESLVGCWSPDQEPASPSSSFARAHTSSLIPPTDRMHCAGCLSEDRLRGQHGRLRNRVRKGRGARLGAVRASIVNSLTKTSIPDGCEFAGPMRTSFIVPCGSLVVLLFTHKSRIRKGGTACQEHLPCCVCVQSSIMVRARGGAREVSEKGSALSLA